MSKINFANVLSTIWAKRGVQMSVLLMAALAAVAVLIVNTQLVTAAETNTANTLKVSPVRTDVEIKPGISKTVKTTVTNLTDASITVRPIENDFVAGDERGTPALILDENKYAPTHSLKRFMTPIADVTIPAGESKTVSVVITVPKDAKAGGYFGAIRFAPTSPDDGGQVNLSASVASLILMTVPGDTTEKLELTDFSIQQNGAPGSYFINGNDLQASVRLESKSDVQLGPFGKVSVKKGDKVVYETDFNDENPRDLILPDSARRWDIPLDNIDSFGKYTVSATFTYGQKNQTIEVAKSFWMIPLGVTITAVVGVLVLIGLGLFLRHRKRYSLRGRGLGGSRR